jgi:membrane protein DedA with SNARE-associated domain
VEHLVQTFGYFAIFLLMAAESACIPIPSEVVMPFAGVLASQGHLELVAAILVGVVGNVVGSLVAWAVGRAGGRPALRRFGRLVWLRESDLDRAERWFAAHGEPAVFFSRLLPVIRTFISLPAGAAEMPLGRFSLYTAAGSLPWSAGLAIAGFALGENWRVIDRYVADVGYVVAVVAVVVIVAFFVRRARRTRQGVEAQA